MHDEAFLTDQELMARWKCSKMKLWRLREANSFRLPSSSSAARGRAT